MTSFAIDSHGLLCDPSFHDGHILGVNLLDPSHARLHLRSADKQAYLLDLLGLERLRCDGFAERNTILSVALTCGAAPHMPHLHWLLGEALGSEPYRTRHEAWVAEIRQQITGGQLTLVAVEPSDGCEIVALCKSVRIDVAKPAAVRH